MVSALENETLAMFFDSDFSSVTYVDALFQSITGSSDKYSKANLAKLSTRLLDLMTHLDYHTNEISKQLAQKINELKKLSMSVVPGGLDDNKTVDGTTRLRYYIDSLKNSVDSLQSDIDQAKSQLDPQRLLQEADPVKTLIQLKEVKVNIGKVLLVLQNVRKVVGGADTQSVGLENFQDTLDALHETLKRQFEDGSEADKKELSETVEQMKAWAPLFQQFTHFGPVYHKFTSKLDELE